MFFPHTKQSFTDTHSYKELILFFLNAFLQVVHIICADAAKANVTSASKTWAQILLEAWAGMVLPGCSLAVAHSHNRMASGTQICFLFFSHLHKHPSSIAVMLYLNPGQTRCHCCQTIPNTYFCCLLMLNLFTPCFKISPGC